MNRPPTSGASEKLAVIAQGTFERRALRSSVAIAACSGFTKTIRSPPT